MKILTGLLVATLWHSTPVLAQLVLTKEASGKPNYSLSMPESKVVDAASFVKKADLGFTLKKPTMVQLDLVAQYVKTKEMCPLLEAPKPSIELDGERKSNQSVELEWEAFNGRNILCFEVERSFDDTLHFERVNNVWAKNIAGIKDNYKLPDENVHHKISYYRLRLSLRSGEHLYSNIAKVGGYRKDALSAYPNPVLSSLTLNITAVGNGNAMVRIFDAAGRVVWQQTAFLNDGGNVKTISLEKLAAGAYTARVDMDDQTTRSVKFQKQ